MFYFKGRRAFISDNETGETVHVDGRDWPVSIMTFEDNLDEKRRVVEVDDLVIYDIEANEHVHCEISESDDKTTLVQLEDEGDVVPLAQVFAKGWAESVAMDALPGMVDLEEDEVRLFGIYALMLRDSLTEHFITLIRELARFDEEGAPSVNPIHIKREHITEVVQQSLKDLHKKETLEKYMNNNNNEH